MSDNIPSRLSWKKKFLFVLLTAGLLFVIFNLLAWLLAHQITPAIRIFESDAYRGFRLKANLDTRLDIGMLKPNRWRNTGAQFHITTDAHGFRAGRPGMETPRSPQAKVFTVICLGDSNTFGWDVDDEQTYPAQLQNLLRRKLPEFSIRMINAGVPSYSSRQGLVYLGRELLGYHPDLVIFAFGVHESFSSAARTWCPIPDLTDADLIQRVSLEQWKPITLSFPRRLENLALRLPLVAISRQSYFSLQRIAFLVAAMKLKGNEPFHREKPGCQDCRVPPHYFQSDLLDLIELGRRRQFLPLVVIPYGTPYDYQRAAFEICSRHRITFVNLHELFTRFRPQELGERPELLARLRPYQEWLGPEVFAQDPMFNITTDGGHPNAVGHALIAEELINAVTPLLRTPPPAGDPALP